MYWEFDSGERDDLYQEITIENVEDLRDVRFRVAIDVTFCDSYLPEGVRLGTMYFQGTPRRVRETLAKEVPELLRRLEAGISETRRSAFSPSGDGAPVPGTPVAKSRLVRGRGKRR